MGENQKIRRPDEREDASNLVHRMTRPGRIQGRELRMLVEVAYSSFF